MLEIDMAGWLTLLFFVLMVLAVLGMASKARRIFIKGVAANLVILSGGILLARVLKDGLGYALLISRITLFLALANLNITVFAYIEGEKSLSRVLLLCTLVVPATGLVLYIVRTHY